MKMLSKSDLRNSTLAAGLGMTLLLSACGGTAAPPKAKTAADENDQVLGGGESESSGLGGGGKLNAEQIVPKAKKREISADQRAEFDKAIARYQSAKKSGGLSGGECGSVSDAFKNASEGTPVLLEALFNAGAVLQECGREDEAVKIWQGMSEGKMKYGPAMTNLGYIAWKQNEPGRAEALFARAIESDPLHTIEARNNLAQILRDKARRAQSPEEKRGYISQAVSHLRNVLALDSNNLQAVATLAFVYYEMNMLEMSKLVGNQAISRAEEIATGKFAEEKAEDAAEAKAGKGKKKEKKKESAGEEGGDDDTVKHVDVREAGTGVTPQMKLHLAIVHNTLGLVELKRKSISPAIGQFKKAVDMNPGFNEARMNLAALSLNNRDYKTAEENFHAVLEAQPKNYEAAIGLGVALRGGKKIEEAETQYNEAKKLDPSNPSSYFNLGLLYQEYKDGQKPSLQKAQAYYREFLSHATSSTGDGLQREAQKRIKDIDEIYVALDEAAKMQAESEEMQRKAEAQQKEMEEKMKQQEAQEAAAAAAEKNKAATPPANGEAPKEGDAAAGKDGAKPADGAAANPADSAAPKAAGGKKKKGKK